MAALVRKMVLDIGTGSGLLAMFAAKKGATSSAVDINPLAVKTAQANAAANNLSIKVIESDLFDQLPKSATFDYLLINPPYFAANPKDKAAHAFFAGENLEYFEKLFRQMPGYIHANSTIWVILSDDCDLEKIQEIAQKNEFLQKTIFEKTKWAKRMLILEYWKES